MTYLATKHKSAKLYPDDLKQRAVVNQRLYFDMGAVSKSLANIAVSTQSVLFHFTS